MDLVTGKQSGLHDISEGPLLLEIAWEVARKVGGIYTVLRTKLPFTCGIWKDRYALVGVYNHESAATEFEPVEPKPLYAKAIQNLTQNNPGIRIHFGRWLVPGKWIFYLVDFWIVFCIYQILN